VSFEPAFPIAQTNRHTSSTTAETLWGVENKNKSATTKEFKTTNLERHNCIQHHISERLREVLMNGLPGFSELHAMQKLTTTQTNEPLTTTIDAR
jgi:hypothetical protein